MEKNSIKKELMLRKIPARFSHYCAGNLYYRVELEEGTFQFPIETTEKLSENPYSGIGRRLSEDLGTTPFNAEEKGSMLIRWIDKAIDSGEFVKVS